MEEEKLKISVAMASYNGEKYIKEQISSILENLDEHAELVISDDGSTDGTVAIVKEMARNDKRVKLIFGPGKGIKKNFEYAIANCTGEYIFLSDQDDIWAKNKVKVVMQTFEKEQCSLVMHDAVVVNEDNTKEIMPSFFAYRGSKTGAFANLVKNSYMGCCMAFKSSLKEWILPIPNEIQMHDQWIGVLNDLKGNGSCLVEEKLLSYRRHEENNSDFSRNTLPVMVKNRLIFVNALWRCLHRKRLKNS